MKMQTPLTKQESDFAADNHGMVGQFLGARRLREDDFYDIVIFGYLRAVRNYLEREDLRTYAFRTIAYKAMQTNLSNHFRSLRSAKHAANIVPFDEDSHVSVYIDETSEAADQNTAALIARKKLPEVLSARQSKVVYLRADGFSNREIGEQCGIAASTVSREIRAAGNAIRNQAPELFELLAA